MSAETHRVAVVQAASVVLDGPASVERACELIRRAGAAGAELVALPEGFVPLMPRPCWGHRYSETMNPAAAELHRRLWENAVDLGGPLAARLAGAAGAWVAIGTNERDDRRPGTLWNTLLWLSPEADLDPVVTPLGRLGGLICWEAFMPMARRCLHLAGTDVLVIPTADERDVWLAAMRAFAFEAGAYVLSPIQRLSLIHI